MQSRVLMMTLLLAGCGSLHTSDPPRTATEQFLMSRAVEETIDRVAAEALRGQSVHIDAERLKTYTSKNDQLVEQGPSPEHKFLVAELRARLLGRGVKIADTADKAQVILEVWSGGVGIDRYETIIGVPSAYFTGLDQRLDDPTLTRTPELVVYKRRLGLGVAGVSLAAYRAKTGELIALSHPPAGFGERRDIKYLLIIERKSGNVPTIERE